MPGVVLGKGLFVLPLVVLLDDGREHVLGGATENEFSLANF